MIYRVFRVLSCVVPLLMVGSVLANGDAQAGKVKSQVCAACHGGDGNSSVPIWPNIAGQHASYLLKQMLEFRKGEKGLRFEPNMYGMTQGLTDADIADLVAYYAKEKMAPGAAQQALVALGEKLYRGGNPKSGVTACSACHSPTAEGNALANFPRLSGQHAEYTVDQLKKFRTGTRKNDPNGIMRDIARRMTDEEIQAVSSYISGLHGF